MSRHSVYCLIVTLVVLSMVAGLAGTGYAQQAEGRFSVQWKDITVADALGALQRQFGIQYVLPSELGSRPITLSLRDVTATEALQQILSAASLATVNEGGVWHIRKVAQAEPGGRTYRPQAGAAGFQPAPYRAAGPGVNVGGAYGPTRLPAVGQQAGLTGLGGWGLTTGTGGETAPGYSPGDMVFRIIPLGFIDPYIITSMFGGGIVGGESGGGSGSSGGYDRGGGYGESSRYDRSGSSSRSGGYGGSYGSDRY